MSTPLRVEAMIAGVSAAIVLLLVPLVCWACNRLQFHDAPGPLKIHARPMPRLGGIAVAVAVVVPLFVWRDSAPVPHWQFCVALAIIWAAALADDLRQLPISLRLASQACAGPVLWLGGYRLPFVPNAAANSIATCIFVIAFVNAFNFLDGADGIAAGSAALAALAYIVVPGAAPAHCQPPSLAPRSARPWASWPSISRGHQSFWATQAVTCSVSCSRSSLWISIGSEAAQAPAFFSP